MTQLNIDTPWGTLEASKPFRKGGTMTQLNIDTLTGRELDAAVDRVVCGGRFFVRVEKGEAMTTTTEGLTLLERLDSISRFAPCDQVVALCADAAAELRRRDAALANAIRQAEAVGQRTTANWMRAMIENSQPNGAAT